MHFSAMWYPLYVINQNIYSGSSVMVNSGVNNVIFVQYPKPGIHLDSDTELCAWTSLVVEAEVCPLNCLISWWFFFFFNYISVVFAGKPLREFRDLTKHKTSITVKWYSLLLPKSKWELQNFVNCLLGIICHFPMCFSSCSWPRERRRSSSGVTATCAMSASLVVSFCCFRGSKRKGAVCNWLQDTLCRTFCASVEIKQHKSCPTPGHWVVLPWNFPLEENQAVVKQQLRVVLFFFRKSQGLLMLLESIYSISNQSCVEQAMFFTVKLELFVKLMFPLLHKVMQRAWLSWISKPSSTWCFRAVLLSDNVSFTPHWHNKPVLLNGTCTNKNQS